MTEQSSCRGSAVGRSGRHRADRGPVRARNGAAHGVVRADLPLSWDRVGAASRSAA